MNAFAVLGAEETRIPSLKRTPPLNETPLQQNHDRQPSSRMGAYRVRFAHERDLGTIESIVNAHARAGLMLPVRSESLLASLAAMRVVEHGDRVVGCGGLHHWNGESAEIRSLAVDRAHAGRGLGRQVVETLAEDARAAGTVQLFAMTLTVAFFVRMGFQASVHSAFPHKQNGDCAACAFRQRCREVAVVKNL